MTREAPTKEQETAVRTSNEHSNQTKTSAFKKPFLGLSKKAFSLFCILLALTVALSTALIVILVSTILPSQAYHRAVYSQHEPQTLAKHGEQIPLYIGDLGDVAIPAIEGVPVCTYNLENFRFDENGLMHYYLDGQLASYAGIDVSAHNGEIDWQAVKAFGIDYAIIRIGGRGYGIEGVMYDDDYFYQNIRGAKNAGLMVGAYFFSTAITPEEAKEEALYCIQRLQGINLDFPVVFDWEVVEVSDDVRNHNISPQTLTECARTFCDTVKEAGYIPCIYTDSKKAYLKFDLSKLSDIDLWYVYYNDTPNMYYNYMMWQYSCTGTVDGISGDVDLNICFKNYK